MKTNTSYLTIFFILFFNPLFAQQKIVNLAVESFYKENTGITSYNYDARYFRDVFPYDPSGFLIRGYEKFKAGFYGEAMKDFNQSIELFPECAICYYFRGIDYLASGYLNQAKSDLYKAIRYDPLLIEAYNDISFIYREESQLDSAKFILFKGLEYYPAYALTQFNLGYIEVLQGNIPKAKRRFKKCLDLDPCHLDSQLFMCGINLIEWNNFRAQSYLDKAMNCHLDFPEVYMWKALFKAAGNNHLDAIVLMGKAINLAEDNPVYYILRGFLHVENKTYKEAIWDFTNAYTINPLESKNYRGSYEIKHDQENYQYILQQYSVKKFSLSEDTIQQFDRVIALMLNEEYKEAENGLKKIINAQPNDAFLYLLYGMCFEYSGDFHLAISNYNNALALDPTFVEVYKRRGLIKQTQQDFQGAVADFNKMYATDPGAYRALKYRGDVRMAANEYMLAMIDYNAYIEIDKDDPYVYFKNGLCIKHLGFYKEALECFKHSLRLIPDNTDTYFEIAKCYYLSGDKKKALSVCDTLISIRECHMTALNLKGVIYLESKNYDQALHHFNLAVECSPGNLMARIHRSRIYLDIGKTEAAFQDIKAALTIDPESGEAYGIRAKIKHLNQDSSACDDLKKAFEYGYTDEPEISKKICNE